MVKKYIGYEYDFHNDDFIVYKKKEVFSDSNSKTLLPGSQHILNHVSNVFHLLPKCGCTYAWFLGLQRFIPRINLNSQNLMACENHIFLHSFHSGRMKKPLVRLAWLTGFPSVSL